MFRLNYFLLVAALIALGAFALGQLSPGSGMPFMIMAVTCWVCWSVRDRLWRGTGR